MPIRPGLPFGTADILVDSAGIIGMCVLAGLLFGSMIWIEWRQKGRPGR
jgi:hypothetical protein